MPLPYQYQFKLPFEELYLEPEPGARVHVLHFKVEKPKGVILYFHGNRSDNRRWGEIASHLTTFNYDVFVMDYRGYGKSVGMRTARKIDDDAVLMYNYIRSHFDYTQLIAFGRSLGSAVAMDLATHVYLDYLILETPIAHINNALYRYRWLLFSSAINKFKFDSIRKVSKINIPTLIIHGSRDMVVPYKFAHDLFREMATKDKKIIKISKGGHNNLNNFELYHESLKKVLDK